MGLRAVVFDRCTTHAGLSALIGSRCYPDRLPESVTLPALVHHSPVSDNDAEYRTHSNVNNPVTRTVSRVQFDYYAKTGDQAELGGDQLFQAWSGYQSDDCDVGYAFIANRFATREDALKMFRQVIDVMVEHSV